MPEHIRLASYLSIFREYLNIDKKHHSDKDSTKLTAASACKDDDGQGELDQDSEDVFLPNIENVDKKSKTVHHSLQHSDSHSSGIFSQVNNFLAVYIVYDTDLYYHSHALHLNY